MEKVKVRIDSSSDSIIQQLKEQLNYTKIQLSIKYSPSGNEILKSICSLLSSFNNLLQLTFKLDNEFNIELSPFLVALKQLKSLEQLTIFLNQNWLINQESELGIGDAIEDSINLKQLNLRIYGKNLSHKINFLSFENAYKKLKNLENLKLWLEGIHIPKQLTCIFKGLSYSQNLTTLSVKLSSCSNTSLKLGLSVFCDELKEMKGLKLFDLQDENFFFEEEKNYSINVVSHIQYLENLDNLNLKIPFYQDEQNMCLQGIKKLKYLRELTINSSFNSEMQFQNYSNIISQCQNLESVNLSIRIKSENHKLQYISSSLQQIKNIKKLEIIDTFAIITLKDFLIFILSLKNQKKLVNLTLDYYEIQQNYDVINPTLLEECQNYIKNLELFIVRVIINQDQIQGHALFSVLWFPLVYSIPSLKEMKIIYRSHSDVAQQQLINSEELILNKKDLQIVSLQFDETFRIEQNNLLKLFQQLSMNVNLSILQLQFTIKTTLEFDDNSLKELSNTLVKCIKLTQLRLIFGKDNNFSCQGIKMLNQGLKQLQELKNLHLSLKKINLPNNNIEILFESIKNLKSLKELSFQHKIQVNNNSQQSKGINGFIELPESLHTISIEIKGYKEKYQYIRGLMQGLLSLNKLRYLTLKIDVLEFQQQELIDLQRVLANLTNLNRITISFKSLLTLNLFCLFSDLQLLQSLTLYHKYKKDFYNTFFQKCKQNNCKGNNKITYQKDIIRLSFDHKGKLLEQDANILNDFFQNSKLESLKLRIRQENEMVVKELSEQFFSSFQYLTNLRKLSLFFQQDNRILWDYFHFFGQQIQNLINLTKLSITLGIQDNHQENNYPLDQLIDKLKYLSNLQKIEFNSNQSSLKELHRFLIGLSNLPNLNSLSIEVDEVNINQAEFYKFKLSEFMNINLLKINLFINKNIESITQFFKSIKNLQNLKILDINPYYDKQNHIFKILRLVKIVVN